MAVHSLSTTTGMAPQAAFARAPTVVGFGIVAAVAAGGHAGRRLVDPTRVGRKAR